MTTRTSNEQSAPRRDTGFSLVELTMAMAIVLTITGLTAVLLAGSFNHDDGSACFGMLITYDVLRINPFFP